MAGLLEKDYGRGWFDDAEPQGGWGNYLSLQGGPDPSQGQAAPQSPERMDPSRMLWAGAIMDVGNAFGSALAGTGASQGNAMRLYGAAKDHNQQLDQRAVQMREMERQRAIEAEERSLNEEYVRSQIAKNQAAVDSAGNPIPKPIGAPQRMANGALAQTIQNPDGSVSMVELGDYANEGRVVDFGGVPYFLNDLSNTVAPIGSGGGYQQPAQQPAVSTGVGGPGPQPPATNTQQASREGARPTQAPPMTADELARQDAERERTKIRAQEEARQQAEFEANRSSYESRVGQIDQQLQRIDQVLKPENFNQIGFGTVQGRLTGGMPFGSRWDDEFDALSATQLLENAQQLSGVLSDSDMAVLRSIGLDRTRGEDFNKSQLQQMKEVLGRARESLSSRLSGGGQQQSPRNRVEINGVIIEEVED